MPKSIRLSPGFILTILCFIGVSIAILPQPQGVDARAYPIFGVFFALTVGILLQPYPVTVLALSGLFICIVFNLIPLEEAFAGFGAVIIWLIAFASIAAKSFVRTPLGRRMACFFIRRLGHSSLSLAYGLTLSECVLAPMIPSNTARATCVTVPLMVSISESLGSDPKTKTQKVVGEFLSLCTMHANQITSALFLTAMASNPMLQKFMSDVGVTVTWGEWWRMAFLPGICCLLLMPWMMHKIAPPQLRAIPNAAEIAQQQLESLPPIQRKEWITMGVFLTMLILWIFGSSIGLSTAVIALGGLCVLLLSNVLSLDDVAGAKDIWDIALWLSILSVMASKLTEYGLVQHYANVLHLKMGGLAWPVVLLLVSVVYYLARYLIPGNVLHACAVYPAFSRLLIACGVPPKIGCMTLALITAFCGFVTPYATSSCPIILKTGYVEQRLWWRIGFITGAVYLVIWGGVGSLWWKCLGYW